MDREWVLVDRTQGMLGAELIKSQLEAEGILVLITQEGAGHALGLTVGPLGEVEVLVPSDQEAAAREIIEACYQAMEQASEIDEDDGEAAGADSTNPL